MAKKINYRKLAFEFISISFAVLAALIVNQCRENHNSEKLSNKALSFIELEMEDNKNVLTKFLGSHQKLSTKIDSILSLETLPTETENYDVELTILSASAWEMAEFTKALYNKNLTDINNITKVYNLQDYYQTIVKEYILKNSLKASSAENNIENLKNNQQFLNTIIPLEEDLIKFYTLLIENSF